MLYFKPFNYPYEFLQISKPLGHSITLKPGETIKAEVIDILPTGGVVIKAKGIHITVQTEIPLRKDTHLLLKVMDTDVDKKIKLQVLTVLDKENIQINLDIFKELKNDSIKFLSDLVFQSLPDIVKSKNKNLFIEIIKELLIKNQSNESISSKEFFIKEISAETLKKALLSSGILFETKLKNNEKPDDLKEKILKGEVEDPFLKELIKNHQTLSVLTGGLSFFIPVVWNDLKNSHIFFLKKEKGEKKGFLCRIDLYFSSVGQISVDIFLVEKDIMIGFFVEKNEFEKKLKKFTKELEDNLKKLGFRYVFISFKKSLSSLKEFVIEKNDFSLKV